MKANTNKQDDAGNVLENSKEPLRVHGKEPISKSTKNLSLAVVAGIGVGLLLLAANRNTTNAD